MGDGRWEIADGRSQMGDRRWGRMLDAGFSEFRMEYRVYAALLLITNLEMGAGNKVARLPEPSEDGTPNEMQTK